MFLWKKKKQKRVHRVTEFHFLPFESCLHLTAEFFLFSTEHRNMPLDDAVELVVSSFETYIQSQREKAAAPPAAAAVPGATRAAPVPFVPPSSDVSYLLNLLADNRQLTIEEIEKVVDYLQERKNKMLIAEGRQPTPAVNNSKYFIVTIILQIESVVFFCLFL